MLFDYSNLYGRIKGVYKTQARFSSAINLSEKSLSAKLHNRVAWDQDEIIASCDALGIPHDQITLYFFTPLVQSLEPVV